jgi:hypothetical protein
MPSEFFLVQSLTDLRYWISDSLGGMELTM